MEKEKKLKSGKKHVQKKQNKSKDGTFFAKKDAKRLSPVKVNMGTPADDLNGSQEKKKPKNVKFANSAKSAFSTKTAKKPTIKEEEDDDDDDDDDEEEEQDDDDEIVEMKDNKITKKGPFKKEKDVDNNKRKIDDEEEIEENQEDQENQGPKEKKTKTEDEDGANLTKKERKKERKMKKLNVNFELVEKAKKMWEMLRRDDCTDETRKTLCRNLFDSVQGKIKQLAFAHDTSRVVECLMKYGNEQQRTAIFNEVKDEIIPMSKSKYAKFVMIKMLMYGTKEQKKAIITAFYGNVRSLLRHTIAAQVIEHAYNEVANATERALLTQEFYGPSYVLFKDQGAKTLSELLKESPSVKNQVLDHIREALTPCLEKSVLAHSMVHHVLFEYFEHASIDRKEALIDTLQEQLIHIVHTHDGSRVAMQCIWYGSAKVRKAIVKSFKTLVMKIAKEEHGHFVLLAAFDAVDDTKLMNKIILSELKENLTAIIQDPNGRKVVSYLLSPRDQRYFHPKYVQVLKQGDGNAHSKKDAAVRAKELLDYFSVGVVEYFSEGMKEHLVNGSVGIFLPAVIEKSTADVTPIYAAICDACNEAYGPSEGAENHIIENASSHFVMKKLVQMDKQRAEQELPGLTDELMQRIPEKVLQSWVLCNRGAFLLVNMLECSGAPVVSKLKKSLSSVRPTLVELSFKGAKVLLEKIDAK